MGVLPGWAYWGTGCASPHGGCGLGSATAVLMQGSIAEMAKSPVRNLSWPIVAISISLVEDGGTSVPFLSGLDHLQSSQPAVCQCVETQSVCSLQPSRANRILQGSWWSSR